MATIRRFNRGRPGSNDMAAEAFGDGLLMRDGYTIVGVSWELDVPAPLLRVQAPLATLPAGSPAAPMDVDIMVNANVDETFLIDDPAGRPPVIYPPADPDSATDVLTVRDRFFDAGAVVPRSRWHFVAHPSGLPRIRVEDGLEPGRYYRLAYRASRPQVAGVGLAAIRDAAAAFRYRTDLRDLAKARRSRPRPRTRGPRSRHVPPMTVERTLGMQTDINDPAARTTARLQQATARGVPVMIPGALDVRHRAPRPSWPATEAPPFDRARIEHEWEGGGAPEMRGGGRRPWALGVWLNRLLHGSGPST